MLADALTGFHHHSFVCMHERVPTLDEHNQRHAHRAIHTSSTHRLMQCQMMWLRTLWHAGEHHVGNQAPKRGALHGRLLGSPLHGH